MAKRKIVWTETAARQRQIILQYWVQHNQSATYSLKLLEASNEKALRIAAHPLSYRQSEFPDTRVAALGHFSMFYKVSSEGIVITAFWDNRQDPKKLMELLMKRGWLCWAQGGGYGDWLLKKDMVEGVIEVGGTVLVELDGSVHESQEQQFHDRIRTEALSAYGITVIRFTNEEVLSNVEQVVEVIRVRMNPIAK